MKIIFIIISFLFIGCGGGGSGLSVNNTDQTTPTITGLQGDINAIEPIDLD